MPVAYFQPRRPGPELEIEDAIAGSIPSLLQDKERPFWTGGSLSIGAGKPDLIIVSCEPRVFALAQVEMPVASVLAYLRAVRHARVQTISDRLGIHHRVTVRCLEGLVEAEAVFDDADVFSLSPEWRDILPEIVTIEVKVADWRRALGQAARNRIFAHRSFVAVPEPAARRICQEPIFAQLGIGLLSVAEGGEVKILRRARCRRPRVWTYYYQLAIAIAKRPEEAGHAIRRCHRAG